MWKRSWLWRPKTRTLSEKIGDCLSCLVDRDSLLTPTQATSFSNCFTEKSTLRRLLQQQLTSTRTASARLMRSWSLSPSSLCGSHSWSGIPSSLRLMTSLAMATLGRPLMDLPRTSLPTSAAALRMARDGWCGSSFNLTDEKRVASIQSKGRFGRFWKNTQNFFYDVVHHAIDLGALRSFRLQTGLDHWSSIIFAT